MARLAVFLLACAVSFGQPPQPDPIDAATQEYHQAHNRGDFEAAAAKREEARKLLGQAPVDSQRFAGWVSNVTGLYRSAGRTAQARGILEETLKRADGVPAVRIQILQQLGDAWVQDGNLVRAVGYWEKAVEAVEKTPPPNEPAQPVRFANRVGVFSYIGQAPMGVNSYPYQRLAGLYRELGRTEAAAQIFEKMRAKLQDNPQALASAYQQEGDLDQALEIYKKQLERATEQQPRLQAIQAIANLYQQEARFADAAAMLAQAGPHAPVYLRLQLGQLQQQAGLTQAADQTYQAAMTEFGPAQVIQQYANHLNQTNRAGQAEEILKSYVASASLEDGQQSSLYYALANSARIAGHPDRASEYQRVATSRQVRHSEPNQIGADLNQAQTMINQGFVEDAFRPAMGTIETVRDNGAWQVGNIANQLGSHKAPEKGDQLFRAYLAHLEASSIDQVSGLLNAQQQYARFLHQQPDYRGQVPAAIDQYRELIISAEGEDSGAMAQVWELRFELARSTQEERRAAEELVRLQESLNGPTSRKYLHAIQKLSQAERGAGNTDHALALDRQAIQLTDLTASPNDGQRFQVRLQAANTLAALQHFDEAEQLAKEALGIARQMHPPQEQQVLQQMDNLARQKEAARPIVH